MSTLDAASTIIEIENAYKDNASYAEDRSLTKARAFLTAVRMLLLVKPSSATGGGSSMTHSISVWQKELETAKAWIEQRDSDERPEPETTRADFRHFRG